MFGGYLLTRDASRQLNSAARRFKGQGLESVWHRIGNLKMTLDLWRLYGDDMVNIPVLNYEVLTAPADQ